MCKRIFEAITSKVLFSILTLICLSVLTTAYVMEHYFAVYPCQMCLYERDVFIVAGAYAFLSFVFIPIHFHRYALLGLGIIFMGGALLATYHVAIQQHWVSLPAFCATSDLSSFESVEDLKAQLLKTPFVRCDQVTWSLFGLSLAFYNALLSFILSLFCWKWSSKCK